MSNHLLEARFPVLVRAAFTAAIVALSAVALAAPARAAKPIEDTCALTIEPGADVQKALDSIAARDGTVTLCLAPGEFRLPTFVSITRDHVRVRGSGRATVLRLVDGVQSPLIVIGDHRHEVPAAPTSDVVVERLRLIGAGDEDAEAHPEYPYLNNSAIAVRGGRGVKLLDLDVSACRSACLLTEHDTRDVAIERSTIHDATWDGISLNRTSRARIVGNDIRRNTAAGITVEHLEDSLIEGNTISDNRSHGIYLSDSYRNVFRKNRFEHNTNAGVFLTCAVRYRDPGPVLCWDDSMSRANRFEMNALISNRIGYIVAADRAANCTKPDVVPNVSHRDAFDENPPIEQNADEFGVCLRRE